MATEPEKKKRSRRIVDETERRAVRIDRARNTPEPDAEAIAKAERELQERCS